MRRLLVIVALVFAHTAWSGDFEDGVAAYERKDYATALAKFRSAAIKGDRDAQYNLGVIYSNRQGVAQDNKQAALWYQLAAKKASLKHNTIKALCITMDNGWQRIM